MPVSPAQAQEDEKLRPLRCACHVTKGPLPGLEGAYTGKENEDGKHKVQGLRGKGGIGKGAHKAAGKRSQGDGECLAHTYASLAAVQIGSEHGHDGKGKERGCHGLVYAKVREEHYAWNEQYPANTGTTAKKADYKGHEGQKRCFHGQNSPYTRKKR